MSKNNVLENAWLALFFNATPIPDVADNDATSPAAVLTINLHTANPDEAGTPGTSVTTYTGYVAQTKTRNSGGWTVSGNTVSPASDITFPPCTASPGGPITHASIAIGNFMYYGALSAPIVMAIGTVPVILAASTITEE